MPPKLHWAPLLGSRQRAQHLLLFNSTTQSDFKHRLWEHWGSTISTPRIPAGFCRAASQKMALEKLSEVFRAAAQSPSVLHGQNSNKNWYIYIYKPHHASEIHQKLFISSAICIYRKDIFYWRYVWGFGVGTQLQWTCRKSSTTDQDFKASGRRHAEQSDCRWI